MVMYLYANVSNMRNIPWLNRSLVNYLDLFPFLQFLKRYLLMAIKSESWNAMPVAPQSISASVDISWLFMVNMQIITKCFPSIDLSNTSTLLPDNRKIPKHFKAFKAKLFRSTKTPSCLGWPNLFPIPRNLSWSLLPYSPLHPLWTSEQIFLLHILPPCG